VAIEGMTGALRPPQWNRSTFLLKGSGREELSSEDRVFLGERAALYPAFG
jgi:hypothetical protein